MKLSAGDLIDEKYRIVRILGTGGMGSVYEATNLRVGRRVAIKVMHKVRDQSDIARFEREARAAQIGSPYIVQVHDLGYLGDGEPYMVMEYLAGESLGDRVHRQGRLLPSELLPIVKQVLEALVAAHRAGIVHRDLKPDNVYLSRPEGDDREIVKLVDFGISKFIDVSKQGEDLSLTRAGCAVGTPHYMSPEQVHGSKELDARSDLYSLGIMLYRCLSGQLPFNSDDIAPLLMAILVDVPTPLRELAPELDRELITIVTRSMARRAEDRFQSAGDFLSALLAWEQTHAANLDAPLVPAGMTAATRTGQHGTAASWSSVTEQPMPAGRNLRNVVLAVSFAIAGVVGLLVAYKLLTTPRALTEQAAASASAPEAGVLANAALPPASPLLVASVVAVTTPPPALQATPISGRSGRSEGTVAAGVATVTAPTVGAAPLSQAALVAQAALAALASPSAVAPATPAPAPAAAPAAPPKGAHPAVPVDPSNRHVLDDL